MKIVRLLLVVMIAACNTKKDQKPATLSLRQQYDLLMRCDSLAGIYPDSAYKYYYNASEIITDSTYKERTFEKMAEILQSIQDYNGSTNAAIHGIALITERTPDFRYRISYLHNIMGTNCLDQFRYEEALKHYDNAIRLGDTVNIPVFMINKGVVYQRSERYDTAIYYYDQVLKIAGLDTLDTEAYARARSNLAKTKWLIDANYDAFTEFHEARLLRELINDKKGLNASYLHLSDYYAKMRPDSAKFYAVKMYNVATELGWPEDQAEALEKLALLGTGPEERDYLSRYVSLKDSLEIARSNDQYQYADIRFNFEKVRADNLALEKTNAENRFRISRQRWLMYGIIGLFILFTIGGVIWYRRKKRYQEMQTQNAIRESELKTSQKVHDVVANGLYRVMNELEHKEEIDKDDLLDKIEDLYEQSRDISYEHNGETTAAETRYLKNLLTAFANEETRVLLVGISDNTWSNLGPEVRKELEYVLQELMVNMKKHSLAKNVLIRFSNTGGRLNIVYHDDGIGFTDGVHSGNGLRNTGNRIKTIGGTITFDGSNGMKAEILIPIVQQ